MQVFSIQGASKEQIFTLLYIENSVRSRKHFLEKPAFVRRKLVHFCKMNNKTPHFGAQDRS